MNKYKMLDKFDIQAENEAKAICCQRIALIANFSKRPKVKVSGAFSEIPKIIKLRRRKMSKTKAPLNETKEAKFVRLGSAYTTKALRRIRQLGNLANKVNYHYTPEQVEKIEQALFNTVEETMAKFNQAVIIQRNEFTL